MKQLHGFDYAEIQFDKQAALVQADGFDEAADAVSRGGVDDVLVLVHGWNNDMTQARALYDGLARQLRAGLAGSGSRRTVLIGLLWPSKRYAVSELIPGGAASAAGPAMDAVLLQRLAEVKDMIGTPAADQAVDAAATTVGGLDDSPRARDEFVAALRSLLPGAAPADPDDVPAQLHTLPGREVLDLLAAPILPSGPPAGANPMAGGAAGFTAGSDPAGVDPAGGAAGLGLSIGGVKAGALRLLNTLTYYEMKDRSGAVGVSAAGVLRRLRELHDLGLHLVGHSFGARLATAAAHEPGLSPDSLTLLQAAFSHNAFAKAYDGERDGFFRALVTGRRVRGPVLVSHSRHDVAVGLAYAVASRLARQNASGLGDANDRYGGLGRNGAQHTPEARTETLLPSGAPYHFADGAVHNLNADNVISDHSDIVRPEVAHAILTVMTSRRPAPAS